MPTAAARARGSRLCQLLSNPTTPFRAVTRLSTVVRPEAADNVATAVFLVMTLTMKPVRLLSASGPKRRSHTDGPLGIARTITVVGPLTLVSAMGSITPSFVASPLGVPHALLALAVLCGQGGDGFLAEMHPVASTHYPTLNVTIAPPSTGWGILSPISHRWVSPAERLGHVAQDWVGVSATVVRRHYPLVPVVGATVLLAVRARV